MSIDRRDFLKTGAAAAAAFQAKNVLGANDRVRIGVIGLRGRGLNHIQSIKAHSQCRTGRRFATSTRT